MRVRDVLRDGVLVAAAAAVGWWWHGADRPVLAQRGADGGGGGGANLAFQFLGAGPQADLAVYSPGDRTLYVYPRVGVGNAHMSCEYSLHITRPGAAMDREICRPGAALP